MIAGDSIVKGQKGWLMSREKMVKVHLFSGATTDDMDFFLKPLLNREPNYLILHTGTCTNDLRGQNPKEIAKRIRLLAEQIYQKGITCIVSLLLTRSDDEDLDTKVKQVNSFSTTCAFMNESVFPEYLPTRWVSVSREVILHFLENRVSTTKCLFSGLQHKNIKKHSKDEI